MTEAIQQFGLDDAAKQLREKIRLAFVELIPKEQWEAMVKAELTKFTQGTTGRNRYGDVQTEKSVFHQVAQEVYREHVKALVKEELAKPEWNAGWSYGRQQIGDGVKMWLSENSGALMQTMLLEMFGHVAQDMVNRFRNGG